MSSNGANRALAASKRGGVGEGSSKGKKSLKSSDTPSKYKNEKASIGGETFDSRREMARYVTLKLLQDAGRIESLKRQVRFVLAPPVRFAAEKRQKPALTYVADFAYFKGEKFVVEDVKSKVTRSLPAYRIKKHLMMTVHEIEIVEVQ